VKQKRLKTTALEDAILSGDLPMLKNLFYNIFVIVSKTKEATTKPKQYLDFT
jgi:hypothetical protein